MKFQKLKSKFKIIYKYKANIWGIVNLKTKLKNNKWKFHFLDSSLYLKKTKNLKFKKNKKKKNLKNLNLKRFFKFKLQEKQKFKYFYGNISNHKLNFFYKKSIKKNKLKNSKNFIQLLESKLDTILYRSYLINNIFMSKYLIKTKKISVNNKIIKNVNYNLNPGDHVKIITTSQNKKNLLYTLKNSLRSFFKIDVQILLSLINPKHLEINYKTLSFIYWRKIDKINQLYYPINLNLKFIKRYYK